MDEAKVPADELDKIRKTDNTVKECDPKQPPQFGRPLELDENGLPTEFKVGE